MKWIWLSTATLATALIGSCASYAADLSRPVPPSIPVPIFSWTEFYIGANMGAAWASGTLRDTFTGASFTGNNSAVIGGGTIGYSWQVAPNSVRC
jgi:outer membrane immunogenic protein